MKKHLKKYLLFFVLILSRTSFAANSLITPYDEVKLTQQFAQIYATLPQLKQQNIATRIATFSNYFINRPYLLSPLGEGPRGKFDQNPLFRDDAFDCQTFVETVLALANAHDVASFKHHLSAIRYAQNQADFTQRNHFTNVDWNRNNAHKGYIQDITYKFIDKQGQPIAAISDTIIDKPQWYLALDNTHLKQLAAVPPNLLNELHHIANQVQQEKSVLLYLPMTKLFDSQKKPQLDIFAQIPSGSIIEIVRPNWNLKKLIGTNLDISHLGFAVRTNKNLMYREASSIEKKVIDVPLIAYLRQYLESDTVKGINVQVPTATNTKNYLR